VVFFAIVLALHYSPFPWRVKKINLLIASYLKEDVPGAT
jgi:hypothetical protein